MPVRLGEGTVVEPRNFASVRLGDGTLLFNPVETVPGEAVTDGLVAWYRFEDGDARDYATNAELPGAPGIADTTDFSGTLSGATFKSGAGVRDVLSGENPSGAFSFDGSDDTVTASSISSSVTGANPKTIMSHTKLETLDQDGKNHMVAIGANNNNESFGYFHPGPNSQINGGATLRFFAFGNDFDTGQDLTLDTFSHVVATYDGSTVDMFVDGVKTPTTGVSRSLQTANQGITLGARQDNNEFMDGVIDDVRMYEARLTDSEIREAYKNTKPLQVDTLPVAASSLVGWWPFGPGGAVDETAFDSRFGDTEAYHGDVNGATPLESGGVRDINNGESSGAFDFDGTDDLIECGTTDFTGSYTLAGWVKFDSLSGFNANFRTIIAQGGFGSADWSLYYDTKDNGILTTTNGAFSEARPPEQVPLDEFVHFAVSVDGSGNVQHYFNGSPVSADAERGTVSASSSGNTTRIGFDQAKDRLTDGTIDDVRVYNRALSDSEINRIFDNTQP